MSVALCHYQIVLVSFGEVSLVQRLITNSSKVPLPLDIDISAWSTPNFHQVWLFSVR